MRSQKHLPALDGIRGLAVLMVFIFHFGGGAQSSNFFVRGVGYLVQVGWSGVTLFFILSGFLISGILWDSRSVPGWWRNFYMRRTLRIFPLYYGTLILVFITAVASGHWLLSMSRMWIFALFLQNMPVLSVKVEDVGSHLALYHFWSLAVEEQFYLIWPLLLTRMRTLAEARKLCLGIMIGSALFRIFVWLVVADPMIYSTFILTRAGELAMGAYLAMCFRDAAVWQRIQALAPAALATSLAGFILASTFAHSLALKTPVAFIFGLPCITIFFASLLVMGLREGLTNRVASSSWLRWLGGISYGIYVFHVLFSQVFDWIVTTLVPHASRNTAAGLRFIVGGLLTLLLAWTSFHFFESRFLRYRSRYRVKENHLATK